MNFVRIPSEAYDLHVPSIQLNFGMFVGEAFKSRN
jgi:hypothetical protein